MIESNRGSHPMGFIRQDSSRGVRFLRGPMLHEFMNMQSMQDYLPRFACGDVDHSAR